MRASALLAENGRSPVAAAAVLASLDPEDQDQIAALIEESMRRLEQAAG